MRIDSSISTTAYSPRGSSVATPGCRSGEAGLPAAAVNTPAATLELSSAAKTGQSVTLATGQWIDLGGFANGKPMQVKYAQDGSAEWSGNRPIRAGAPGTTPGPDAQDAMRRMAAYTPSEHESANTVIGVVSGLRDVAQGTMSADFFNSWAQHGGPGGTPNARPANIQEALNRLGLDNADQPFNVNGTTLRFTEGNLVAG